MDKLRKLVHAGNYAPQQRREKGQNDDNYWNKYIRRASRRKLILSM